MRKVFSFAVVLISTGLLSGCTVKCDNFDTAILNWMPFKVDDEIIIQDTLANYTLSVIKSQVDHSVKRRKNADCICEDRYWVTLNTSWLNIDLYFNNSKMVENSDAVVNSEVLNYSQHLFDQTIDGIKYEEVIVYKNPDQSASVKYKELVIANSIGIISLTGATLKWQRVDPDKREVDPAKVTFNDFSCL